MSNDELRKVIDVPEDEGCRKAMTPARMVSVPTPPRSQPAPAQPQAPTQPPTDNQKGK